MECPKCNSKIEENVSFCPYCGEKIKQREEYQDPFEKYRNNTSHEDQMRYQKEYSSKNKKNSDIEVSKESSVFSKKLYNVLGIILMITSIIVCFFQMGFGVALFILGLILIICGYRHAKKGIKIASVVVAILSAIGVIISCLTVWLLAQEIDFANGMKLTVGEYFSSMFFNSMNEDKVYGIWQNESGEILDLTGGFYYNYYDKEGKILNEGSFHREGGYEVGRDDIIYSDREFYFYSFIDNSNYFSSEKEMILCLDKNDLSRMILYFPKVNVSIEMRRVYQIPEGSSSKTGTENIG